MRFPFFPLETLFLQKHEKHFSSHSLSTFLLLRLFLFTIFLGKYISRYSLLGILAFLSSGYGIQQNIIKYRTLGLSILALTVAKILLYDIWYALDNAVMRIVALMVVGGLMIVISLLYSKNMVII